jgi:hypothetical protein
MLKNIISNKFIGYKIHFRELKKEGIRSLISKKKLTKRYRRFLFLHIRKTGGTSFNRGLSDFFNYSEKNINDFLDINHGNYFIKDFKIFAGGNIDIINNKQYHIATTHLPQHQLLIDSNTFTFTILRDPVRRFISHYNMLRNMILKDDAHHCLIEERNYYDDCIVNCALKMPIKHRSAQLYCFSKALNPDEGLNKLSELTMFDTLENYRITIEFINKTFNWEVPTLHIRKGIPISIPPEKIISLQDILKDEIAFYKGSLALENRSSNFLKS